MNAPPAKVREALQRSLGTLYQRNKALRGHVYADRFSLMRNIWAKRNLRPTAEGRLLEDGDGTVVELSCALPGWAKYMGRAVLVLALVIGVSHTAVMLGGGLPDLEPWMWWAWLAMATVWMPIVGVLISGRLVQEAVEERTGTPDAIREVLAPLGLTELEVVEAAESRRVVQRATEGA